MTYDEVLEVMDSAGLVVKEKPLKAHDGLIKGRRVAIRKDIPTTKQKAEIAAEELAHHLTASGDLRDYSNQNNWKQEIRGRHLAYDIMVGLNGIVRCYEQKCLSISEAAECLDVTQKLFIEAIDYYHSKYGRTARYKQYLIFFEPALSVCKLLEE